MLSLAFQHLYLYWGHSHSLWGWWPTCGNVREEKKRKNKKAVLLLGEPRDAAVTFNTCRVLQRLRAVFLPRLGFLVHTSDRSNAEITHSTLIFTAMTQNHGDSRKSRHMTKIIVKVTVIVNTWLSYTALINVRISYGSMALYKCIIIIIIIFNIIIIHLYVQ